jgi:peptidoglycan/xylan/chitin deacetylase (PgdA/CDA1 family)
MMIGHNLRFYYLLKPLVPRRVQIGIRRRIVIRKRPKYIDVWPIDPKAAKKPEGWKGWPEGKQFALVLTHDVDTRRGHDRCRDMAALEDRLGLRSSFNFVPERYKLSPELREELAGLGFEVGVHGLYHDGKLLHSKEEFLRRAEKINGYLSAWNAVGFRAPCMQHNLEWFHNLNIEYDSSTYDTDPFELNPKCVRTIFPFYVEGGDNVQGYVELPYTIPQDFTLFVMMRERTIDIWKMKLDWVVEHGGMALINVHPDYMNFCEGKQNCDEYPALFYREFLEYIKSAYNGMYWHALPREVSRFWTKGFRQTCVQGTVL